MRPFHYYYFFPFNVKTKKEDKEKQGSENPCIKINVLNTENEMKVAGLMSGKTNSGVLDCFNVI